MQHIAWFSILFVAPWAPATAQNVPAPFEQCNSSPHANFSLMIERLDRPDKAAEEGVVLRIRLRNISDHSITVFWRNPEHTFAANVTRLGGERVELTEEGTRLYSPLPPNSVWVESDVGWNTLQPMEELTYNWKIDRHFDLSSPGDYYITLGYRPPDEPDDMICSNRLALTIFERNAAGHK